MKKNLGILSLALVAMGQTLSAAGGYGGGSCSPEKPATCNEDDCCRTYCIGPDNTAINAPVRPFTCNGDWELTIGALYWQRLDSLPMGSKFVSDEETHLYGTRDWEFGFEAGIGYNGACDNWDFGVLWTHIKTGAHGHEEAEPSDNVTLNAFFGDVSDVRRTEKSTVDYIDMTLGREFWNGQKLSLRPFIGVRVVVEEYEDQREATQINNTTSIIHNDNKQDYTAGGILFGIDSNWNLGCGWAIFGDFAFAFVGGKNSETNRSYAREVVAPFARIDNSKRYNDFQITLSLRDLALGVKWAGFFCDCDYRFETSLGWEHRTIPAFDVHGLTLRFTFDF